MKLKNYTDPVANPTAAGDLSIAIEEVARECGYCTPSKKIKIGEVNELLDELANIKKGIPRLSQEWRTADNREKPSGGVTVAKQRAEWVQKLLTKLTPSEHKWMVRILLQKVEVGIGYKSVLKYYSPFAEELYNANNSLKRLCTTLSNPVWIEGRKERARQERLEMAEDRRYVTAESPGGEQHTLETFLTCYYQNSTVETTCLDAMRRQPLGIWYHLCCHSGLVSSQQCRTLLQDTATLRWS